MTAGIRRHVAHHIRFYGSVLVGALSWLATGDHARPIRMIVAGDVFFLVYLLSMAAFARGATPAEMRRRATFEDDGIVVIMLVTLTTIGLSLWSIFSFVNRGVLPDAWGIALVIAGAPLGWLALHTVAAFHYGHLYYGAAEGKGERRDAGGFVFPGTKEPTVTDFLYFSFVVGMTAQVSDVEVRTSPLRRLVLVHGLVSFFFNTVILALAVNAAAGLGR